MRMIETLGGVYQLARLAVLTRFRFSGAYWRWRLETAFGQGYPRTRLQTLRAVLEYGRWMHRMRRG